MRKECCSTAESLTAEDRKGLSAWRNYERKSKRAHTCLAHLEPKDVEAFEAWLTQEKGSNYAKRSARRLRTAARRQGAGLPNHLLQVDLETFVPHELLSELSRQEKTACRHFVRYAQAAGQVISFTSLDTKQFEQFREWLYEQAAPGQGQKDHIISAFRRVCRRYGRLPEQQSLHDITIEVGAVPLVAPYLEYLESEWAPSTVTSFLHHYRSAVYLFLRVLASYHEIHLAEMEADDLFAEDAIRDWTQLSLPGDPLIRVRAISGLLRYWSAGVEPETLQECLERVGTLRPTSKANKNPAGFSPKPEAKSLLHDLVEEYTDKLFRRHFFRKSEAANYALRRFLQWCGQQSPRVVAPSQLTTTLLDDYIRLLLTRHVDQWLTAQHYLSYCGGFWRWLYHRGQLPDFREDILPRARVHRIKPRRLSEPQVRKLLRSVQNHDAADYIITRDTALLVMGLTTGPRAVELRRLTFDDVDLNAMWVRYYTRKGSVRKVPLPEPTAVALESYLSIRKRAGSPTDDPYVFLSGNGAFGFRLQRKAIYDRFRVYRELAGIPESVGGFHVLRHTFASQLAADGYHPEHIRELLGHETLVSTNAYLHGYPASQEFLTMQSIPLVGGAEDVRESS